MPIFFLIINLIVIFSCKAQEKINLSTLYVSVGQKQLFLDNYTVESLKNLKRVMHQPEKRGPVLRPQGYPDGKRVQARSAPFWAKDESLYKLYYIGFPWNKGEYVRDEIGNAFAISKDGLHWERPDLYQVPIGGSKINNRFYPPDTTARWTANAMYDVIYDSKPGRPYKGLMGAHGRAPVVSLDGIKWEKLDVSVIASSDVSRLIYDEQSKQYIAVVKVGSEYGRSAAVAFSKDFENWTEPVMTFRSDEKDQEIARERIRRRLADPGMQNPMFNDPDPETGWKSPDYHEMEKSDIPTWRAEIYGLAVFPYEGLYIGLPQFYYPTGPALPGRRNTVGFNEIQLMFSRDPELGLESWVRLGNREPFIETSRLDNGLVGNFDRQQISPSNRPLVMGDELWFYYNGMKSRTPPYKMWKDGTIRDQKHLSREEKADFEDGWSAICLATLRLDGFVSLYAGDEGGEVVTKPFKAIGDDLFLNTDVRDGGEVKVEVLDVDNKSLFGFQLDDCVGLTGSDVRQKVTWQTGSYWGLLKGKKVKLRIFMQNASLYAFWMEEGASDF